MINWPMWEYTLKKLTDDFSKKMEKWAWSQLTGERMPKLYVAVGAARCGKSTYGASWLEKKILDGELAVIVSSDSLRLTITGQRYLRSAEPIVHMVNRYFIMDCFRNNYDVYIDETNTTLQNILNWLEIDPDLEFVYFHTSIEECEKRAIASGQRDLVDKGVIKRHAQNIENLVRTYYPDVAVREDGMRDQFIVLEALEEIRRQYKATLPKKFTAVFKETKDTAWGSFDVYEIPEGAACGAEGMNITYERTLT